jgi:hypothetical protein
MPLGHSPLGKRKGIFKTPKLDNQSTSQSTSGGKLVFSPIGIKEEQAAITLSTQPKIIQKKELGEEEGGEKGLTFSTMAHLAYGHRSLGVPSTGRAPEYLDNLKNEFESMTHEINMYVPVQTRTATLFILVSPCGCPVLSIHHSLMYLFLRMMNSSLKIYHLVHPMSNYRTVAQHLEAPHVSHCVYDSYVRIYYSLLICTTSLPSCLLLEKHAPCKHVLCARAMFLGLRMRTTTNSCGGRRENGEEVLRL